MHSVSGHEGRRTPPQANPPTPCIRLFCEPLTVDRGTGFGSDYREIDAPALALGFDYGGVRVGCSDPLDGVFRSGPRGTTWVKRDRRAEAQAQYVVESLGAVEVSCLSDHAVAPGSAADYLVKPGADVHALCSFSAYAIPQLRGLGWRVEIDADYPYQIIAADAPWYADVATDEKSDWFNFELGVEVGGQRINLLQALLDLIDRSADLDQLDRVAQRAGRCVALPTGDGRFLPLPPERLQGLVRVLLELYRGDEQPANLQLSALDAGALAHLDDLLGDEIRWCGDAGAELRARGRSLGDAPSAPAADPPAGLRATLRGYQEAGLAWLQHLREHDAGGVLADDMGLGKTLQTIAFILSEKQRGADLPALVVAPTSLIGNWQRELSRFAPALVVESMHGSRRHSRWRRLAKADVVITTYGLLYRDRERFEAQRFHLLVLDEAQAVKNPKSRAHRAIKQIDARYRVALTGTPVENSLGELWSLFDIVMPALLGSAQSFRQSFQIPIEKLSSQPRLDALRERVAPFILRRMKEDVAPELPPKTELVCPVSLGDSQRELYESIRLAAHADVRCAIRQKGMRGSTIAILDALMKLRQVCCDPRLVSVPSARGVIASAKCERFFELIESQRAERRRTLVFSQFTSMLALLAEGLKHREVPYLALTGASPHRQRLVDEFERGRAEVFLISLKAGGTGLNLTSADTVVHYDPWWNPAAQAQATDRAYRIGQTKPVFVHNLIVAGSVEERMLSLQRRKKHLADTILGRAGRNGSFDENELEALFAPLSEGS